MGANYSVQNPYARKYCSPATIKCAEPVRGNAVIPCNSCQPRCDKTTYEWRTPSTPCSVPSSGVSPAAMYPNTLRPGLLQALPFQSIGQGVTTMYPDPPAGCKTSAVSAVESALGLVAAKASAGSAGGPEAAVAATAASSGSPFERLFRENGG